MHFIHMHSVLMRKKNEVSVTHTVLSYRMIFGFVNTINKLTMTEKKNVPVQVSLNLCPKTIMIIMLFVNDRLRESWHV